MEDVQNTFGHSIWPGFALNHPLQYQTWKNTIINMEMRASHPKKDLQESTPL